MEKFSEKFRIHNLCSVTYTENGFSNKKNCVKFCTDRQARDCNVTRRTVMTYCIIKTIDTHSENLLFKPFFGRIISRPRLSVTL
jgi:hypothetical protein